MEMLRRFATITLCQGRTSFGGRAITRNATRFTSRVPAAIVNEDELFESKENPKYLEPNRIRKPTRRGGRCRTVENTKPKRLENEPQNEKSTTIGRYTTLKENDHFLTSLMMKVKVRKERTKNKLILLEGCRLINDAIHAGANLKMLFFSRSNELEALSIPESTKLYKVPYRTIQLWSNLTTSPGIIGIFETPNMQNLEPASDTLPLTIICDNVREPGNLGSILRAAAAVGCEKLVLLKGCVDLWDPKVLRSASGAHFRLCIHDSQNWEDVPSLISAESRIFLADNNNTSDIDASRNEKRVEQENNDQNTDDTLGAREELNILSGGDNALDERKSRKRQQYVRRFLQRFPIVPYYSLDYTEREVVLVISGETESLGLDSCKILYSRDCLRVNIPMTNGVESLNNGMALGIVAFEIKRQFLNKNVDQ